LTQGGHKEFNIPEKDAVCFVTFDSMDQAIITRYVNVGHEVRVKQTKEIPKLKEGEKFWEVGGSYMYMKENGDIVLSTVSQGYFILENNSGTLKSETVNWKVLNEGGSQYHGLVKRLMLNADGTKSVQIVTDSADDSLTEYRLKVVETADNELGVSGLNNPLCDIIIGTVVDEDGNQVDKDGDVVVDPTSALCLKISFVKSGTDLLTVTLDKSGQLIINGGTNGVARKEDATLINSTTDSSFTSWMTAVDTFLRAASSAGALPGAVTAYTAAVASVPTTVDGKINAGSDSVKVGN